MTNIPSQAEMLTNLTTVKTKYERLECNQTTKFDRTRGGCQPV
jgi:hypothetical protein